MLNPSPSVQGDQVKESSWMGRSARIGRQQMPAVTELGARSMEGAVGVPLSHPLDVFGDEPHHPVATPGAYLLIVKRKAVCHCST